MNPDDLTVNIAVDDSKFKAYLTDFMKRMDDGIFQQMMIQQTALSGTVITSAADTAGAVWPTIPVVASIGGTNWTLGEFSVARELADEVDAALPYVEPVRRQAIALRGIPLGAD